MIGFAANVFSVIVSQYGICARCYDWFAVQRKYQNQKSKYGRSWETIGSDFRYLHVGAVLKFTPLCLSP